MKRCHPATVSAVLPKSPAAHAGILPGHRLLRVNGRAPRDYIEYRYLTAEPRVALQVESGRGERRRLSISKPLDQDLGLRFTEDVFDRMRTCRNRCPFCFVDQLPPGLRPSLYLHDDDYRLSFLHGSFITLTNLTAADCARIARLHLSPLHVSVHATEPDVRKLMFGRAAPDALSQMRRLAKKGIEFHTQIVICPGLNDGPHLERTVHDLAGLHPGVCSIGVVPVGLTRHRRGRAPIRRVTPRLARRLLAEVARWQKRFLGTLGTRFVFAADELYLSAGLPLPGRAQYEGFAQLANGIGCARLFLEQLRRLSPARLRRSLRVTLVTGEMAAPLVKQLAAKLEAGGSVEATVRVVRNRLLGSSVTTAGLLSARDIARTLAHKPTADLVLVPATALREGEGFLDGITLEDLSRRLGVAVLAAGSPREAAAALRRFAREAARSERARP